jgi:MerR family transcriptional regulator, copper efflux regulator
MRIGQFSEHTGLTRDTIRFYEKQGLLKPIRSGDGGYREYATTDVDRCAMIRLGQQLGFSLAQIRELATDWESNRLTPAKKRRELMARLEDIDMQIAGLQHTRCYIVTKLEWMANGEQGAPPSLMMKQIKTDKLQRRLPKR